MDDTTCAMMAIVVIREWDCMLKSSLVESNCRGLRGLDDGTMKRGYGQNGKTVLGTFQRLPALRLFSPCTYHWQTHAIESVLDT